MVNPGASYSAPDYSAPQPIMSQQPISQTQSVVSNMAAYSSSKFYKDFISFIKIYYHYSSNLWSVVILVC